MLLLKTFMILRQITLVVIKTIITHMNHYYNLDLKESFLSILGKKNHLISIIVITNFHSKYIIKMLN
ncbi:hypothetical protein XBKQ1_2570002 [Xenorhabdus bovienii str. kraussei Quebec]|uniref:Uncharacterized protein n=1 Tax=Xenorhabdus bovienii str. kraussei Quebec TaxID=1398203 RepID=A0A077PI27_XENBV|nr:hypothetical protein XBKQ1_2570002 [Xenorhabdus bovienii str. kraussei Quebec]